MKEKYPPPKETVWKKWFDSFQEGDLVWFDYDDRWYIPHEDWIEDSIESGFTKEELF